MGRLLQLEHVLIIEVDFSLGMYFHWWQIFAVAIKSKNYQFQSESGIVG